MKKRPKQINLHIVFCRILEGWSGTYEDLDKENKLIELNPNRGRKKTFSTPYHEFTHWMIEYFGDRFEWRKGWKRKLKKKKKFKKDDKEDKICYEVDRAVWGVLSKYLKKGKK